MNTWGICFIVGMGLLIGIGVPLADRYKRKKTANRLEAYYNGYDTIHFC